MEQMLTIGLAHVEICSGEIIRTMVRADGEPHRDSARRLNDIRRYRPLRSFSPGTTPSRRRRENKKAWTGRRETYWPAPRHPD
jgi:hypothetical protein